MLYAYDRDVGDSLTCIYRFPVGVDAAELADEDDRRFCRDDRIRLYDYIAWERLYDRRDGIPPPLSYGGLLKHHRDGNRLDLFARSSGGCVGGRGCHMHGFAPVSTKSRTLRARL